MTHQFTTRFVAALLTACVLCVFIATASAQPPVVPPSADESGGKKYAILVGVDDYIKLRKLRYAKNDVEALRDQLFRIGFEKENVFCLVGGGKSRDFPNRTNIETTLTSALKLVGNNDTVMLVLCGHGVELGGRPHFCPIDADDQNLLTTTIPIDDIFHALTDCNATFKLMIVDACREDAFRGRNIANTRSLQTITNPPAGVVLLQSCATNELSYEDDEFKHGLFTYYLIDGLKGNAADKAGKITLMGLYKYATDKTVRRALAEYGAAQRPYLKGELTDFVLAERRPHVQNKIWEYRLAIICLEAELTKKEPVFPDDLPKDLESVREQQLQTHASRQRKLASELQMQVSRVQQRESELQELQGKETTLKQALDLATRREKLAAPMVERGLYSEVDFRSLQQEVIRLQGELSSTKENISKAQTALEEAKSKQVACVDSHHLETVTELNKRRSELASLTE